MWRCVLREACGHRSSNVLVGQRRCVYHWQLSLRAGCSLESEEAALEARKNCIRRQETVRGEFAAANADYQEQGTGRQA